MDATLYFGFDDSALESGLRRAESLVDSYMTRINSKMAGGVRNAAGRANTLLSGGSAYAPGATGQLLATGLPFQQAYGVGRQMDQVRFRNEQLLRSLDRTSSMFTGGLGIGVALGGFNLLERAMSRAVEKARQFEVATLSIAATLSSNGKRYDTRTGRELSPADAFQVNLREARDLRRQILNRSALNILSFEEQLGAFQSSINPGSRKGLSVQDTLLLSEKSAVVAKTLGLRGEEIANASRLLLGGGVNVGRSTIGRALGISNQDVAGRSGEQLKTFLMDRMRGFEDAEAAFGASIEGMLSTIESRVDTLMAKIGERFLKNPGVSGVLENVLIGAEEPTRRQGESDASYNKRLADAAQSSSELNRAVDSLSNAFTALFTAIQKIVSSGAFQAFTHFMESMAGYADIFITGAVLMKGYQMVGRATEAMRVYGGVLNQVSRGDMMGGVLSMAMRGGPIGAVATRAAGRLGEITAAGLQNPLGMTGAGPILSRREAGLAMLSQLRPDLARRQPSDRFPYRNAVDADNKNRAFRQMDDFFGPVPVNETAEQKALRRRILSGRMTPTALNRLRRLNNDVNASSYLGFADAELSRPGFDDRGEAERMLRQERLDAYTPARKAAIAKAAERIKNASIQQDAIGMGILSGKRTLGERLVDASNAAAAIVANTKGKGKNDPFGFGLNQREQKQYQKHLDEFKAINARLAAGEDPNSYDLTKRESNRLARSVKEFDKERDRAIAERTGTLNKLRGVRDKPITDKMIDREVAARQAIIELEARKTATAQGVQDAVTALYADPRTGMADPKTQRRMVAAQKREWSELTRMQRTLAQEATQIDNLIQTGILSGDGLDRANNRLSAIDMAMGANASRMMAMDPRAMPMRMRMGMYGARLGDRLGNYGGLALMGGMLGYGVLDAAGNMSGPNDAGKRYFAGAGGGLLMGASVGGLLGGVPGAVVGGGLGVILGPLIAEMKVAEEQALKSAEALKNMQEKFPGATRRIEVKDRIRELEKQLKTGFVDGKTPDNSLSARLGRFWSAVTTGDFGEEAQKNLLSPQALAGRIAAARRELEKTLFDTQLRNDQQREITKQEQTITNRDKLMKDLANLAQTPDVAKRVLQAQFDRSVATVRLRQAKEELVGETMDEFITGRMYDKRTGGMRPAIRKQVDEIMKMSKNLSEADAIESVRRGFVMQYTSRNQELADAEIAGITSQFGLQQAGQRLGLRAGRFAFGGRGQVASALSELRSMGDQATTLGLGGIGSPGFSQAMQGGVGRRLEDMQISLADDFLALRQLFQQQRAQPKERMFFERELGLRQRGLSLEQKQASLDQLKLALEADRLDLVVPRLKLQARQLDLDAEQINTALLQNAIERQDILRNRGRMSEDLTRLNSPLQTRKAQISDTLRVMQAQIEADRAVRGVQAAKDQRALFFGQMGPVQAVAGQIQQKVQAEFASGFDPVAYEAAYRRSLEAELTNIDETVKLAEVRAEAAQIDAAIAESYLNEATVALARSREDALRQMLGFDLALTGNDQQAKALGLRADGLPLQYREMGLAFREAELARLGLPLQQEGGALRVEGAQLSLDKFVFDAERARENMDNGVLSNRLQILQRLREAQEKATAIQEMQGAAKQEFKVDVPLTINLNGIDVDFIKSKLPGFVREQVREFCEEEARKRQVKQ